MCERKIITWQEVLQRHGTYSALGSKGGKLSSILCGSGEHGDEVYEDHVIYRVPRNPRYRRTIQLLSEAATAAEPIIVFRKLARGSWQDLGTFVVHHIAYADQFIAFRFERAAATNQGQS